MWKLCCVEEPPEFDVDIQCRSACCIGNPKASEEDEVCEEVVQAKKKTKKKKKKKIKKNGKGAE